MDDISVPRDIIFYHGAFVHHITPEGPLQPQPQNRVTASLKKLAGFSETHLIELSSDMYDELQRRNQPQAREKGPLTPRNDIHWKRNDARKHVGSLPEHRFKEICRDLVTEQERRHPELKTGPTYPLQDAMPMAVRPRTQSRVTSQGSSESMQSYTLGSKTSIVSGETESSSPQTESKPSLSVNPSLQIQSVSESNITPTKVQIIESDSENESDYDDSFSSQSAVTAPNSHHDTENTIQDSWEESRLDVTDSATDTDESPVTKNSVKIPSPIHEIQSGALSSPRSSLEEGKETRPVVDQSPDSPRQDGYLISPPHSALVASKDSKAKSPSQLLSPTRGSERSFSGEQEKSQGTVQIPDDLQLKTNAPDMREKTNAAGSHTEPSDKTGKVPPTESVKQKEVLPTRSSGPNADSEENDAVAASLVDQNEISRLREEIKQLHETLSKQMDVTERVRKEAAQFLMEMRELTEQHERQVSRAEFSDAEANLWKLRHSKVSNELELARKTRLEHAVAQPVVPQPLPANCLSPTGKVELSAVNEFLSAISALVAAVHDKYHSQDLLDLLHSVITSSRKITVEDRLVSRSANQLISVVRNYTVSTGLFPRIMVDSASSDLTMAVVEYVKSNKVKNSDEKLAIPSSNAVPATRRASPPYSPSHLFSFSNAVSSAPKSENNKKPQLTVITPARDLTTKPAEKDGKDERDRKDKKDEPEHSASNVESESVLPNKPTLVTPSAAPESKSTESASVKDAVQIHKESTNEPQKMKSAEPVSVASLSIKPLNTPEASSSSTPLGTPSSTPRRTLSSASLRYRPQQGPEMPLDQSVHELQSYLEDQTSYTVDAISALLTAIKGNAVAGELEPLIVSIQTLVGEMIDTTAKSIEETRSRMLKDKGTFIVQNMRDCLIRMDMIRVDELKAIREDVRPNRHLKQRLAGVNFDMAKCTKELVKSVEEAVLQDEVADLDRKLN